MKKAKLTFETLKLGAHSEIIRYYLDYSLITASAFTNSKIEAQTVSIYAITSTCAISSQLQHLWQLGELIDDMTEAVGRDIISSHTDSIQKKNLNKDQLLFADKRTWAIARALNSLDPVEKQMLILNNITLLTAKEISTLYNKSISFTRQMQESAGEKLARKLEQLWGKTVKLSPESTPLWLDQIKESIDPSIKNNITHSAIDLLAKSKEDSSLVKKYLDQWNRN